ncbi:unnamed protein product [Orchesella dallaii]|uniref:Uncharacterized protein n=1 Tax=Orchesella dallaii TaxID=48710 RepID=A0ABP1PYP3_9HEXA
MLGLYIDETLTFSEHCMHVLKKCYASLSKIYQLKRMLSFDSKKILIDALIMSVIRYACPVWLNKLSMSNKIKITRLIRNAGKFVMNKLKYDSISDEISNTLEWLMPNYLCMYESILLTYNITFSNCKTLKDYLDFSYLDVTSTRSNNYRIPTYKYNSNYGERTFKYQAVKLWLQLPTNITSQHISSQKHFKKIIMSHILKSQNNDTCHKSYDNFDYNSCIDRAIARACKYVP